LILEALKKYINRRKTMSITIDVSKMQEIGIDSNVRAAVDGDYLILVIDTSKDLGLSSSGKMRAVGNTSGFQQMPNGLRGNVYVGKKA
jgi:hypothetical protein